MGVVKYSNVRTAYGPRWYRSRTEAQWAAFFTYLGIIFHYEPCKFNLGYCRYIPDFYLPTRGIWIEVKGGNYGDETLEKIRIVAERTGERAFLFGEFGFAAPGGNKYAYGFTWNKIGFLYGSDLFTWGVCPTCGRADVADLGRAEHLPCACFTGADNEIVYADESNLLIRAYKHVFDTFPTKSTTTKLPNPGTVRVSSSSRRRSAAPHNTSKGGGHGI